MTDTFLTHADLLGLRDTIEAGYATAMEVQDPQIALTFLRRHAVTGQFTVTVKANIRPVKIGLGERQPLETTGELRAQGEAIFRAGDIVGANGRPALQPGDRFDWQGHACRIDMVHPEKLFRVQVDFTLHEGN